MVDSPVLDQRNQILSVANCLKFSKKLNIRLLFSGYLYTGLEDGTIVKVKDGKVTTVAQTGRTCGRKDFYALSTHLLNNINLNTAP